MIHPWQENMVKELLNYRSPSQLQEQFIKAEMQRLNLTVEQLKAGYVLEVDQNQRPIRLAVNTKGATIIDEVRP